MPASLKSLQELDRETGAGFCRECGCTELYACPAGCYWVEEPVPGDFSDEHPTPAVPGLCSECR